MDKINKLIILPIIAAIALLIKGVFHIDFPTEAQNAIADAILSIITIYGIFQHPKDPQDPPAPIE